MSYYFNDLELDFKIEALKKVIEEDEENNMPATLEHERMRFNTMTERQLWTRLGKITTPAKVRLFIRLAEERGYIDLAMAGQGRLARLENRAPASLNPAINRKSTRVTSDILTVTAKDKKAKRKIDMSR
jgi:hypothetical protein